MTQKKTFYSLNEKIKAFILATNFSSVLDSYARNCGNQAANPKVSDDAFKRALDHWVDNELFSFEECLAATTKGDMEDLMRGFKVPIGTSEQKVRDLEERRALNFLALLDSKERVRQAWQALNLKVQRQLAMFDSNAFSDSLPTDDISKHQRVIRVDTGTGEHTGQQNKNILEQLPALVDEII